MPWKCPTCRTAISHSELEAKPRPNVPYRCVICRLELGFDPTTNALVANPLPMTNITPVQRCDSCGGMLVPPQITGYDPPKGTHYVCLA
jgi:hypothetical protein